MDKPELPTPWGARPNGLAALERTLAVLSSFFFFFWRGGAVLGFELRAFHWLGRHSTSSYAPAQSNYCTPGHIAKRNENVSTQKPVHPCSEGQEMKVILITITDEQKENVK
jgi:hypothetical protein